MARDCFYLNSIEISGLWGSYNLNLNTNKDINLFIGTNGSGKTTLLNLINYILSVDIDNMNEINFKSAKIVLVNFYNTKKHKTIKIEKIGRFNFIYKVGANKFEINFSLLSDRVHMRPFRQNLIETRKKILEAININPVKNITVYRKIDKDLFNRYPGESYKYGQYSDDEDAEFNPIDTRIKKLLIDFAEYRETLNYESNKISEEFKMDVLRALLKAPSRKNSDILKINYNKNDLNSALKNLGFNKRNDLTLGADFVNSYEEFKNLVKRNKGITIDKIMQMPVYNVLDTAIELSKESDKKKQEINTPVYQFLEVANNFLGEGHFNKKVSIFAGRLKIENKKHEDIEITKLSSGEKQLLILLLETLLQKNKPQIYIIDEPELSLHISWQRAIVKSILQLNPNVQLLIATHSPEIVAYYKNKIINMENIIK